MENKLSVAVKRVVGMIQRFVLVLALGNVLVFCDPHLQSLQAVAAAANNCDADNGGISLPPGFCARVFADNLGNVRHIAARRNGDLYAVLQKQDQVLALRDRDGDGRADIVKRFGKHGGSGIGIYDEYLYVGSPTAIQRYPLHANELLPGSAQTIVEKFPRQSVHAAKTFAFDDKGHIYINIGAPSNACQRQAGARNSPGIDPCPQLKNYAGIWRFDAVRPNQQARDGIHYATGIRNAVAIAWRKADEHLYVVQHGRDQLHELWPQYFSVEQNAELPAEEFLKIERGANFGWPYCYYDQRRHRKVLAPEYGGDGDKTGRCGDYRDPIMAFPGHWAPNGLIFYDADQFPSRFRGGAFIAFHGSWNRSPLPQRGYNVVFVPFNANNHGGEWEVFADGFAGAEPINSPSQARFRPMGLAQGSQGELYIADTVRGRIWRVTYQP